MPALTMRSINDTIPPPLPKKIIKNKHFKLENQFRSQSIVYLETIDQVDRLIMDSFARQKNETGKKM